MTATKYPSNDKFPSLLLLTLVFSPDGVSTATIMTELAAQFSSLGHKITVLTTTPHYNRDAQKLAMQPLRPRWHQLLLESEYRGIKVYHARMHQKGRRILSRLLDYFGFHVLSTFAGLRLGGDFKAILAPSPPLTIGLSAILLSGVRRVPFIYNVQEIYPDIAVSMGVLRSGLLVRVLEMVERFIYYRASAVVVISESFRQRLLAKGVPERKLRVIPNFADLEFVQPGDRHNLFSRQHELDTCFVILYAGNIGLTLDLDTLIATAQELRSLPEVRFLVVGDGARRVWLAQEVTRLQLSNVSLLPYQPQGVVPELYATSDICLVPMRRDAAHSTFPSKIYTVMAAGRAAIAAAEVDSELARIVGEANCGFVVPPGDPVALVNCIRAAYERREELRVMGLNGREYVVRHHSPQVVARQYHELLLALIGGQDATG